MKSMNEIIVLQNELPTDYADRVGVAYSNPVKTKDKKIKGQFLTPVPIARFMGRMGESNQQHIKILDPGCGTAILSCALIEHLSISNKILKSIHLDLYDTDCEILKYTSQVLDYLQQWLLQKGITFTFCLKSEDFILSNASVLKNNENLLFSLPTYSVYDLIISNPPYFKLNKDDLRAKAGGLIVKGQPNIYALFMAISSKMLSLSGQLIFITPRSFTSGSYFKTFREFFFCNVNLCQLHLFNSRKDTFNRDNVLQETVILKAARINKNNPDFNVTVTSSDGIKDLAHPSFKQYPQEQIINLKSKEKILHIPINDDEEQIIDVFKHWHGSLNKYQIQISTGPVVAYRSTEFIREVYENGTVFLAPLIWLHNVNKMHVEWPLPKPKKGQYIQICEATQSQLIPNKNYILLRRFSSKDDKSRLVASPYYSNSQKADLIGVENKVNYIYRPKGDLEISEVVGLAAVLNSTLFDNYFRIFNGNVNVSATELREIKLPPLEQIKQIGEHLIENKNSSQETIDNLVNQILLRKSESIL